MDQLRTRLEAPRVAPLTDDELSAAQLDVLGPARGGANLRPGQIFNLARTIARAPEALNAFLPWGNYVLSGHNSLSERDRELVILRVAHLCNSPYEWTHHRVLALRAGMRDAEIDAVRRGAAVASWSDRDRALIDVSDDLVRDHSISNAAWSSLKTYFSERQCMDVVFTVAQYTQVAMILNGFGVQLEDSAGYAPAPDVDAKGNHPGKE